MNLKNIFYLTVTIDLILISCVESADHLQHTCPLWHYYSKSQETCKCCYGSNFNSIGNCSKDYLNIDHNYCITYNQLANDVVVAKCLQTSQKILNDPLRFCFKFKISTNITAPEINDGHGPAVFSDGFTCADCSEHRHLWVLNLLFQLTMVTILYIIIVVFQINGTASPLNILITYIGNCSKDYLNIDYHYCTISYISTIWFQEVNVYHSLHWPCEEYSCSLYDSRFSSIFLPVGC